MSKTVRFGAMGILLVAALAYLQSTPSIQAEEEAEEEATVSEGTTLGAVTWSYIYQSHMLIGMIGDARAKEVYQAETAKELLQTQQNILENVETQLNSLKDSDELEEDDDETVGEFISVCEMLGEQIETLRGVWEGTAGASDKWTKLRAETLEKITEFGDE